MLKRSLGIVLFLLLINGWTSAQDMPLRTVYIDVSIETTAGETNFDEQFLAQLELRLAAVEILPVFAEANNAAIGDLRELPTLYLFFSENDNDAATVFVSPSVAALSLSPALQAAIGGLSIYVDAPDKSDAALNLATAMSLYTHEDCTRAAPYFQELSKNAELLAENRYLEETLTFYQANCMLLQGDMDTPLPLFEKIVPHTGRDWQYLWAAKVNQSWIYLQQNRESEAFATMNEAVESLWGESYCFNLCMVLTKRSQLHALAFQFEEAVEDMDTAIELQPYLPSLYVERGQRFLLQYEWDRVLANYNHAIELDPDYAKAYFERGILFYTQGPRENALVDFQRYIELAPEGWHATEATQYIADIETQLELLTETP